MAFPVKRHEVKTIADLNKYILWLEQRLSIFRFINGNVRIGQPDNYTEYISNGLAIRHGTARTINVVWVDAGAIKAPGAKPATLVSHGVLETPAWQFANQALVANQQSVSFNVRKPEQLDTTAYPFVGIGWSTTPTDPGDDSVTALWQLEYLYVSENESTIAGPQDTIQIQETASGVAEGFMFSMFENMDLFSADDLCAHCKLTRLSASADDTISAPLELHGLCMGWVSDRQGTAT